MRTDIAVVGGGLGGLAAAAYAARAGRSVVLCEKAPELGGRAATHSAGGFRLNLGPHAVYRGGEGRTVLRELGVSFRDGMPKVAGGFAIARGAAHALPGGFVSMLTTGLFGLAAKLEASRLLGSLASVDPQPLQRISVADWIEQVARQPGVRELLAALIRLASYGPDADQMSAGTAVAQLQRALGEGVSYVDGGWQTLVDGLCQVAKAAGARVLTSARVAAVEPGARGRRVRLASGEAIEATAVILASPPQAAAALVPGTQGEILRGWATAAIPVKAACLDVALSRLPRPGATFALGIDRPLYLSVHSAVAALAPTGAALIHVAKYLGASAGDARADERELEGLLDLIQPGWREAIVERRFLPSMSVTGWLPTAASGGLEGRPGPEVPGADDLLVVGDWVGAQGLLADASLASARRAASLAVRRCSAEAAAA